MKTVIEMAREADLIDDTSASDWYVYQIERFAELVRADERARMVEQPAQSTADKSELETVPAKGGLLPAQQEPVACANGCCGFVKHSPPAQRKPLTRKQLVDAWIGTAHITHATERQIAYARAIEAKLKEKNT